MESKSILKILREEKSIKLSGGLYHELQDGNGRVGRLIALKEYLKNNIVPFIIEDEKKFFYYRGLSEWNNEKNYLLETCREGQDIFINLLEKLGIKK